jgi:hypothetical protein
MIDRGALTRCCALAALFLLAGLCSCFDYNEDLTLGTDGSARFQIQASMADPGIAASLFTADKEFHTTQADGRVWSEKADSKLVLHVDSTVKDIRSEGEFSPGEKRLTSIGGGSYSIESLGFGRYRIRREFARPNIDPGQLAAQEMPNGRGTFRQQVMAQRMRERAGSHKGNASDSPKLPDEAAEQFKGFGGQLQNFGENLLEGLSDQMYSGHQLNVTLHAPLILSSNATAKKGLAAASWSREMNTVWTGDDPLVIEATVMLIDYRLIAAGVIALLLLIVGIVLLTRRGRAGSTPAAP